MLFIKPTPNLFGFYARKQLCEGGWSKFAIFGQ